MEVNIEIESSSSSSTSQESGSYELIGDGKYYVETTRPGDSCQICGTYSTSLLSCNCEITYCISCLSLYFQSKLLNFDNPSIKYPNQTCSKSSRQLAKASLSPEDYKKFNKIKGSRRTLKDPKLIFCNTPDCSGSALRSNKVSTCSKCRVEFIETIDPGRNEILEKMNIVECPKCSMLISLSFGCMQTYCICGCSFCGKCGKELDNEHADWRCALSDRTGRISWIFIALLLYFPVVFPFSPMLLIAGYHYSWNRKYFAVIEEHPKFYIFVLWLFSPMIFVFALFLGPLVAAGFCVEALFGFRSAQIEGLWLGVLKILFYIPAGFLSFVSGLLLVALAVSFAPLVGIILAMGKLIDPKKF